jgi:hypothetical protein
MSTPSILASPTCLAIAGTASSVGQSVRTAVPICVAEYPYASSTPTAISARFVLENDTRIVLCLLRTSLTVGRYLRTEMMAAAAWRSPRRRGL